MSNRRSIRNSTSANDNREQWRRSRDDLVLALHALGFPEELGDAIASHLGSPKAIDRMTAKKKSQEANAAYNALLYYGLGTEDDEGI